MQAFFILTWHNSWEKSSCFFPWLFSGLKQKLYDSNIAKYHTQLHTWTNLKKDDNQQCGHHRYIIHSRQILQLPKVHVHMQNHSNITEFHVLDTQKIWSDLKKESPQFEYVHA